MGSTLRVDRDRQPPSEPRRAGSAPIEYLQAHRQRFVAELAEFVRYPSVSAQAAHAGDVRACSAWLARHLRRIGLEHVHEAATDGPPIVRGQWLHAPGRPTLLVYGHYDVQPAEPLHEWASPPFEPTIRGEHLYGRGAADDKGQLFVHLKAIEGFLQTQRMLPVNVKCLFEGEEEIGSPHLARFIEQHGRALAADVAVVSDTRILGPTRPALTESLRGALSLDVTVRGPKEDLHSGSFGGAVLNPLQALCELVARLHDAHGRIAIPGFYDRVRDLSRGQRAYMSAAGPGDADILAEAGLTRGWGEPGYSLYERTTIRPSLVITAVMGGHQGPGANAIIPARATAKLNFRLAADQDPAEVDQLFRRFVAGIAPRSVAVSVRTRSGAHPVSMGRDHPAMRAAAVAYHAAFGSPPVFLRGGGTIPVVHLLQRRLNIPSVMMGFALPDSHRHAPNERFHLPTFFAGIRTSVRFLTELASGARS